MHLNGKLIKAQEFGVEWKRKKQISFKVTQLPQFSDTIKKNIVALSPQAAVCLLFYLFFERFVL